MASRSILQYLLASNIRVFTWRGPRLHVSVAGMDWGLLSAAGALTISPGAFVICFVRNNEGANRCRSGINLGLKVCLSLQRRNLNATF
jgi:hypothetical protein